LDGVGIIGKYCHELGLKVAVTLIAKGCLDAEIDIKLVFVGPGVWFKIETGDKVLCPWIGVSSVIVGTDPKAGIGVDEFVEQAHKIAAMIVSLSALQISITPRLYPSDVKSIKTIFFE
jgi:hypothetical protein